MDGKLAFKGDYVADGNSVGAGIGDFMCGVRVDLTHKKLNEGHLLKTIAPH